MQHLETVTVPSGGSSSITFMAVGDIPSEYTDLLVVSSVRGDRSGEIDGMILKPNGSATNGSARLLVGTGSSAVSATASFVYAGVAVGNTATSNTFANTSIYIPNYRSSVAKSFSTDTVTENNATNTRQIIAASLWDSTDAITSIVIEPEISTNFLEHSSFSLYGITAGSDGVTTVS